MISDTLSDAIEEIRSYQKRYGYRETVEIEKLLTVMDAIRVYLDLVPSMAVKKRSDAIAQAFRSLDTRGIEQALRTPLEMNRLSEIWRG